MGTMIHLSIGTLDIDWGKNDHLNGYVYRGIKNLTNDSDSSSINAVWVSPLSINNIGGNINLLIDKESSSARGLVWAFFDPVSLNDILSEATKSGYHIYSSLTNDDGSISTSYALETEKYGVKNVVRYLTISEKPKPNMFVIELLPVPGS